MPGTAHAPVVSPHKASELPYSGECRSRGGGDELCRDIWCGLPRPGDIRVHVFIWIQPGKPVDPCNSFQFCCISSGRPSPPLFDVTNELGREASLLCNRFDWNSLHGRNKTTRTAKPCQEANYTFCPKRITQKANFIFDMN